MSQIPQRQAYGMALADYGDINPDVVVLDADVSSSTLTKYFADRYPARFFNMGVTEASMVDVGVGLALGGALPFVNTFAALLTLRACEQIRTCVAFALNDVALMRAMPNMLVVTPADNVEAAKMVAAIAEHDGPVYMRISRAVVPDVFDDSHVIQLGQGVTVCQGSDATLIGSGNMVGRCVQAADMLARENIRARVLSLHTLKPLDVDLIRQAAEETGALVTAEDHSMIGGLGSAVAEALAGHYPAPVESIGLNDTFAETGPDTETLMDACGLSVADIVEAARRALRRKTR
jgi:transketolase